MLEPSIFQAPAARNMTPMMSSAYSTMVAPRIRRGHVRGRVSRGLVGDPFAEVGGDPQARVQVPLRVDRPSDAAPRGSALGRVSGQRLGRDAALACDLQAPLE